MGTISNTSVYHNDPSPTVGEGLSTLRENQTAFREMVGALPPSTVTALGDNNSLPINSASVIVDVPDNAQVQLISIRGNLSGEEEAAETEFHNGMVIKLWGVSGKTVTLKHKGNNPVASYNIQSIDNADIVLSSTIPTVLTYDSDNNIWIERERTSTILSDTTGDLSNLTTTHRENLVAAINEVKGNATTNATGLSNLTTKVGTGTISNKVTSSNIVAAINDLVTKIGLPLSNLTTSVKTSLITAINSLVSGKADKTDVGTLSNLTTTEKGSLVGAINEVKSDSDSNIGLLTDLKTTNKSSVVGAVNELYGTDGVVHKSGNETIAGTKTFSSTIAGSINGNAATATQFSANKTVALTGDVTGSTSSKAGWSVATTLSNSGVTAGDYGPSDNASPAHGASFNVPSITVDAKGRVTFASTKTITLPSDSNTDTLVTQNKSTSNNTYPVLMTPTANATSNQGAKTSIFATGVKVNPSTNVLSASGGFVGDLTGNAATATKATQDEDGNTIKTTYAKLASPTFTGTPKAPTASASTNNTQIATTAFVKTAISNLVSSAPTTLDTLNEIATALGNDPNFATTMATQLGLKANDADVVHKTGNEEIAGEKSFSSNAFLKHNSIDHTAIPASDSYRGLYFTDKNDATLARIMYYKNASGITGLSIGLKATNGTDYLTGLSISATTDGEVRAATSSSPALDDSSTKIATTAWIRSATGNTTLNAATATKATQDGNGNEIASTYLPLSGGTMTGAITKNGNFAQSGNASGQIAIFNGTGASDGGGIWLYGKSHSNAGKVRLQAYNGTYYKLDVNSNGTSETNTAFTVSKSNSTATSPAILTSGNGQNYIINAVDTSVTKGTAPSANRYWGINFYGKDHDSSNKRIGLIETQLSTNNVVKTRLVAYNCTTNTNTNGCSIYAIVDGEGNAYTEAPNPSDTADNSTKIATTAWIRSATGNTTLNAATATKATNDVDGNAIKTTYAKLASPTFTGTPKAPTASASTNNTQIATTAFVKTAISNLVNSAPTTLDTLNEIATALGNDPNFATTMTTQLGLKANDADVVHKTGDETVAGEKTLSGNTTISRNLPILSLQMTTLDTTQVNTSTKYYSAIGFCDKNGLEFKNRTALIRSGMSSSDSNFIQMCAINPTADSTAEAHLGVYYSRDGHAKAVAPSTLTADELSNSTMSPADTDIITRDFIPKDTRIVHTTGDEEIAGTKDFTDGITLKKNADTIKVICSDLTKGTVPSSNKLAGLNVYANTSNTSNNTDRLGGFTVTLMPNGSTRVGMIAYKNVASDSSSYANSYLFYPSSGSAYMTAPPTREGETTSDEIITRGYLDTHKVEKTYWRSRALNRSIAEAITATSTTPYTLTTTDFGSDYKEILFKFVHTSAQSAAATFKLKVYFSDNNTALAQINNFLSTAANNYLYLKIINNFGLAECYSMCATKGSLGAWYSLTGDTGSVLPVLVDPDATITKVELYSSTSSVTQIPSGFAMYSWGRK